MPVEEQGGWQEGRPQRQSGGSSSLASLASSLRSLLSSSSSTAWITSLLPSNILPAESEQVSDAVRSNGGIAAGWASKSGAQAAKLQTLTHRIASTPGDWQSMHRELVVEESRRSPSRRGAKRQLSDGGRPPALKVAAKAPRLFSTPSPNPSAAEGPNSLGFATHEGAERACQSGGTTTRQAHKPAARREATPPRLSPRQAAEQGLPHVPKSSFKGVSCHKQTFRWESSLWLNGRQIYLGGFATEEEAAHAYDLAALGCKGPTAETNFDVESYGVEMSTELKNLSQDEVISWVRRRSNAFARGKSKYRGVSGRVGRWETRIGSFGGFKNVSFGVHDEEERAARMYDRAMILEKGRAAKTNFPLTDYDGEVAAFRAHCSLSYGHLHATESEERAKAVTLPMDEYFKSQQPAGQGERSKRKPRPRRVNAIFAADLETALKHN